MSAFSFINEPLLKSNRTSNKNALENDRKIKQERTGYQQPGQASNSLFIYRDTKDDPFDDHNSRNSSTSSLNKDSDSCSRNFKSLFPFIDQDSNAKPTSYVAKHQPLKFSSSFIMEDFMDSDEDRVSSKSDKNTKKENTSNYSALMEKYPSTFVDKKRNGSRKGKGKLTQSMLDDSVSSDRIEGRAPLIKSAFDFINQGNQNRYGLNFLLY